MTQQFTRIRTPMAAAAALSLFVGAGAPGAAFADDGDSQGQSVGVAIDASQSQNTAMSTQDMAKSSADVSQSDGQSQSEPPLVDPPTLASLDFDGIVPDNASFAMPKSAERFKQADGSYKIGAPIPGGPAAGAIVPGLEAFYQQKIEWGPCADFDSTNSDAWATSMGQCGYLIVPVDYSKPEGATIAIGLYKVSAKDQANKIGSLFVDPGGPGGSGMGNAHRFGLRGSGVVSERFDYIGFDPRGVGASLPMIRCQSADAMDKQRQDDDYYDSDQRNSITKYNTEQCYSNTGKQFNIPGEEFIGSSGTVNVVRDLDIARAAVGDTKINYLGYSYGTSIGYHYAKAFPDNIRTAVIDGVVNPFENNEEGAAQYAQYTESTSSGLSAELAQMQGFQSTFEQYLKTCAQEDGFVYQGVKQPCATGTNPDISVAMAEYHKIARVAWQNPNLRAADGRVLSFIDMSQATILAMYADFFWAYLNNALLRLRDDNKPDAALELADWYYEREDDGTYPYGTTSAFPSIWCTDAGTPEGANNPEKGLALKKKLFEIAPFMDPGQNADGTQRGLRAEFDWCTFYRNQHTLPKGENLAALPNVLVISTTYDPSTPYQDGVVAADAIDGTLLTVAGNNHTAYRPGAGTCAAEITEHYLVNMTVPTDITGQTGVETKDLKSNVITGNECRVDSFRPTPALQSVNTNQGFEVEVFGNGLVRNTSYTLQLPQGLGGGTVVATSNEVGEISFTIPVAQDTVVGDYTVTLVPTDLSLNDPTVRAEGTIKVVPFLVPEDVEKVLDKTLVVDKPVFDLSSLKKKEDGTAEAKGKSPKTGTSLAGTGATSMGLLAASSAMALAAALVAGAAARTRRRTDS